MILTNILEQSVQKYSDKPALTMKMGYRNVTLTYKQVYDLSKKIAVFLENNGIGKDDKVMICAPNSPYWICVFWATLLRGAIIVPLNIQSTKQIIQRIAEQTEAKIIFKHLFFKHELSPNIKQFDIEFINDLVENIDISDFKPVNISPEDLVQIMYTSGTTGDPKGVMLSHKNLCSNQDAISELILVNMEKDRILSILPLSHIFEQMAGFLFPFRRGIHIIYSHSYAAIRQLMKQNQITKIIAVPEFLQILLSRIEAEAESKGKLNAFNKLINFSQKLKNKFIARIMFHSVLKALGGKLDTVASGGAPLDLNAAKKWEAFGIDVLQGYGLTETSPIIATNTYHENRLGSVGKVISGVEVKLGPDKEILVKGPNVFSGYYKNEEKTKEVFTPDGWFMTGDLGEFDKDGFLYIRGRKKYMIKGPGGQNVYPEDIETELNKIPGILSSCVLGIEKPSGAIEIHAVLLLDPKQADIDPEKIIELANSELAAYQHISAWTVWPDIDFPRTAVRKIKKDEVRKFLEGRQTETSNVEEQKKSRIVQMLAQITGSDIKKINDSTKIVPELGIDSLMRVELVAWLAQDLGITIEESDIKPSTTVKDLEDMILTKKPVKESAALKNWPRSLWIMPIRYISQKILFLCARIYIKLKVEGIENLKDLPQPAIFMPNHISVSDSLVVAMAIPWRIRKKLSFAAAQDVLYEQYKSYSFFGELIFNSFPIQRAGGENIKQGLDFIGQMLDKGYSTVIFPEGYMSKTGQMQELRRGAGLVAVEMDSWIVPMKIIGTNDIVPYNKLFPVKRGEVKVIFGKPIKFKRSDSYALVLETIEKEIKSLQ